MNADEAFGVLGFDARGFLAGRPVRSAEDAARAEAELKAAAKSCYRRLALAGHPDKGGDPEWFKLVNRAHDFIQKEVRVRPLRQAPVQFVFQDLDTTEFEMPAGWTVNMGMWGTTVNFYGGTTS